MYDNANLSDVVLKAGETKICAHKVILAAQSPAFKAMFQVHYVLLSCLQDILLSQLIFVAVCLLLRLSLDYLSDSMLAVMAQPPAL